VETFDPVWLFGAIALLAGLFLGVLIARLMNPSSGDIDQLKAELERERTEMARYRASVDSHFNKTSELVNELTQDYVKVYRHLAEGAQTLSETRKFTQVLEQPQGRVLISVDSRAAPSGETPGPEALDETAAANAAEPVADRPGDDAAGGPLQADDETPAAGVESAGERSGQEPGAVTPSAPPAGGETRNRVGGGEETEERVTGGGEEEPADESAATAQAGADEAGPEPAKAAQGGRQS
jgi:uncharacterized membrane-anchored protein YhcB (DUF1043 family)